MEMRYTYLLLIGSQESKLEALGSGYQNFIVEELRLNFCAGLWSREDAMWRLAIPPRMGTTKLLLARCPKQLKSLVTSAPVSLSKQQVSGFRPYSQAIEPVIDLSEL